MEGRCYTKLSGVALQRKERFEPLLPNQSNQKRIIKKEKQGNTIYP